MKARERMARRIELVADLTEVDTQLKLTLGMQPSNAVTSAARGLLNYRAEVCRSMAVAGYQPWDIPADIDETKVVW